MPSGRVHYALKYLRVLNELMGASFSRRGSSSLNYRVCLVILHSSFTVLVLGDVWWWCSQYHPISTRLVKTIKFLLKVSLVVGTVFSCLWSKKNKVVTLIPSLESVDNLVSSKEDNRKLLTHLDLFFLVLFSATCLTHHLLSRNKTCDLVFDLLSDLEEFQALTIILTSLKLLTLLSHFLDETNDHLQNSLYSSAPEIDTIGDHYKKLYRVLELWNDVHGVQLLQIFLYYFVVLVDSVVTLVMDFRLNGWGFSWKRVVVVETALVYLVSGHTFDFVIWWF